MKDFKYLDLIEQIKRDFKIDYYGDHGINHWRRVYTNTQKLSSHYNIDSEVFELFALLHDSKRHDEFEDLHHGIRAAGFVQKLLRSGVIALEDNDAQRLLYACANHTKSDKDDPLFNDLIVQICFDSLYITIAELDCLVKFLYSLCLNQTQSCHICIIQSQIYNQGEYTQLN